MPKLRTLVAGRPSHTMRSGMWFSVCPFWHSLEPPEQLPRSVYKPRGSGLRWQWLYQRGFKCGVAHMPKVCPISCAKTRTARKLMRPLVPLNGFSVVTWRLSELTAPPEPRHTELMLAYEWQ